MPQPQDVQVTLTPVMNGSSFSTWQMTIDGKSQNPGTYPAIEVPYGNNADFTLTIQNGPGITFKSFLVPAENTEIHTVKGLGTTTLTFKDRNQSKGPVPYEILFNNAGKLDPIIDNDGGGPPLYANYLLEGAGLIAAAALVFFVLRPMFRRRSA